LRELSQVPGSERHITQLLDVVYHEEGSESHVFLVMNYISTNLDKFLKANQFKYSEKHIIQILFSLLQSLHFIHSANIMHRDIKPGNLLVTDSLEVVLCDFGLARSMPLSHDAEKIM
jgi:mitogen-activated protein kinase 7